MGEALLLIDLQNDYFPGGAMELVDSLPAVANARRLLERFRRDGLPIFHVRHLSIREGSTFFIPDTAGAEIHPEARPLAGERVLIKHFPNCFHQTTLFRELAERKIAGLSVAGMMTHMCVDTTVRAARDLGFAVTLYGDACATRDLSFDSRTVKAWDVQTAYLAALSGFFAVVKKTDTSV